uniref:Uncharacterized protein n=1 Tax=Oryza meridionalis TaxID=40149 RepID=A0A0E0DNK3_9ORYZ
MAIPRTKACDGVSGRAAEAAFTALSSSSWSPLLVGAMRARWEWAGWRRLDAVREEAKSG